MILGRFGDTTGSPYVEGVLILPRLAVSTKVSFLLDTGADRTVLHPADAIRLRLDYSALTATIKSTGIGGSSRNFVESATVLFEDGAGMHVYRIPICIPPVTRASRKLPSLLGRDIVNRWRMVYNPTGHRLSVKVMSSDEFVVL